MIIQTIINAILNTSNAHKDLKFIDEDGLQ